MVYEISEKARPLFGVGKIFIGLKQMVKDYWYVCCPLLTNKLLVDTTLFLLLPQFIISRQDSFGSVK